MVNGMSNSGTFSIITGTFLQYSGSNNKYTINSIKERKIFTFDNTNPVKASRFAKFHGKSTDDL